MASAVHGEPGGIRSLLVELRKHGEAITHDLMAHGWSRSDLGRRITWKEFYYWLVWLPPTGKSAYFRAKKPNSWWVTAELQIMAGVLNAVEGANWQRGGGKGTPPKPIKFPEDREIKVKDSEDLKARKEANKKRRQRG